MTSLGRASTSMVTLLSYMIFRALDHLQYYILGKLSSLRVVSSPRTPGCRSINLEHPSKTEISNRPVLEIGAVLGCWNVWGWQK